MFGGLGGAPGAVIPPPIPNAPSVPPAAINQPSIPNIQGMGGIENIFKAIFDPASAAKDMATNGVTPEMFAQGAKSGNLANVMSAQNRPASPGDVYTRSGMRIIQSGEGISPATPDQFITANDIPVLGDLMNSIGQGQLSDDTVMRPANTMGPGDTAQPIVPPILPPQTGQQVPPIVPPILPPTATTGSEGVLPVPPPETVAGQTPMFGPNAPGAGISVGAPAATPATPPASQQNATVLGGAGGGGLNLSGNRIFTEFMDTVHSGGLTNPNGLAAVAATGKSESAFDPKNAYGSWNDPSEKGVSGTSGGILSWRAERFNAMQNFVKENGGDPSAPSPALQAKYFLQENPGLIKKLQAAKTPEEAQTLMNEAWQFAGYNRPGGERDRRIALARNMVGTFGGAGGDGGVAGTGEGAVAPGGQAAGLFAGMGAAPTTPSGAVSDLTSALDTSSGGASQDLNLPDAPSPVAPRPGGSQLGSEVMKVILALLAPGQGANQVPTLAQLMQGRQA